MTEELHLLEISKWQRAVDAAEEKINLATLDCNSKAEFRKKQSGRVWSGKASGCEEKPESLVF